MPAPTLRPVPGPLPPLVNEPKPIFYDERQRRWWFTRRALEISGALFTLLLFVFLFNILQKPDLPQLLLPDTRPALHALREKRRAAPPPRRPGRKRRVAALGKVPEKYDPLRAAFYVSWDSSSLAALQQHYRDLDVLIVESLHAVSPDGRLDLEKDPRLQQWLQESRVEIPTMALVNNYDGAAWRTRELAELLARAESRRRLANSLASFVNATRQAGLVVDFEEVPDSSQSAFRSFFAELASVLRAGNLKLMVALPAADTSYDYAYFASQADAIILMNYDQHWPASAPGPIAAQDWFLRNLNETLGLVPPEKLIMAIGSYAYDWTEPPRRTARQPSLSTSFQQAIVTAQESEGSVEFDPDSLNPHFSYVDERNRTHRVWMLDAATVYNQLRASERAGVRGTVLWRLGSEDPSLWSIWDATRPDDAVRARLQEVPPGYDLILEGDGDIWRITATPQWGRRTFRYDPATDTFTDESFPVYPLSYRIDQLGAVRGKIALTFDDGPDPRFTPQVLDILKEKRAPAAFFLTGLAASGSPGLVRRIYAEGHEIGNHTYTHPHFDQISSRQLGLELSLTERLLESSLGIKTILFRPPYGVDHQPESADEVRMLPIPQGLGYVIVGARIDPHDWGQAGGGPPAPPAVIASRVLEQAKTAKGYIVLLHDGGGDRSATVAALPRIIDGLRAEGFELVPLHELLGQTRAQIMPSVEGREQWLARADALIFNLYHWLRLAIAAVFVAGIALVSGRAVTIGILALVERFHPAQPADPSFRPFVSVLIPAYNEEDVIVPTVRAVLDCDYPDFEVLVVNDGSTDRTGELLRENFGPDPPSRLAPAEPTLRDGLPSRATVPAAATAGSRVRIFSQPNRGKSEALNRALAGAGGEIAVTIDADTAIDPQAISRLVRHFADPSTGAVAGNAKVGNRNRWLTRWQALEYITSQNLEKRAFSLLNCITVVPGAVGAWRVEALRACGGFSADTVAEDTDLTLAIRRRGWRILYDEDALGWTQAPETAGALVRQRFRWTFGTLQAFWKHRDTLARRRYGTLGWVALPHLFLFQVLLPLFSPLIDLLFLGSLALWGLAQLRVARVPQLWTAEDVERALVFFVAFMLIDFLTCVIAFALEKNEDWTLLAPLVLQRFYYRQMMYVVLFSALVRAVQGRAVGWGHPPRREPRAPAPAHT